MNKIKPKSFNLNGQIVYCAKLLKKYDPIFFYGTSRTIRKVIDNRNIPQNMYVYSSYNKKKNEWTVYNDNKKIPNRAVLYLHKEWVDVNLFKTKKNDDIKVNNEAKLINDSNNEKKEKKEKKKHYDKAPPLVELKEKEKFRDEKGNTYEVEVRGERKKNKCYFLASDIAKHFEKKNFNDTVTNNNNNGYIQNMHYLTFICYRPTENSSLSNKKTFKKELFLTYKGVLKAIFSSYSNGKAEAFEDWASDTLFIHQFGTDEELVKLCYKSIGYSIDDAKKIIKKLSATSIGCLYFLSLNTVGNLRESFNVPSKYTDDMIVCKYGRADDLNVRLGQHNNNLGKIEGVDLKLLHYVLIDKSYQSNAETELSDYFDDTKMKYSFDNNDDINYKEIVIINKSSLRSIKQYYSHLGNSYGATKNELIAQRVKEIDNLTYKLELEQKEKEYLKKELEREKKYNAEQLKDKNEIIKMKDDALTDKNKIMQQNIELAELKIKLLQIENDKLKNIT